MFLWKKQSVQSLQPLLLRLCEKVVAIFYLHCSASLCAFKSFASHHTEKCKRTNRAQKCVRSTNIGIRMMAGIFIVMSATIACVFFNKRKESIWLLCIGILLSWIMLWYHATNTLNINW